MTRAIDKVFSGIPDAILDALVIFASVQALTIAGLTLIDILSP